MRAAAILGRDRVIPRPIASAIIIVVTIVWAANFVAQFLVEGYTPDVSINGIFMAIVGAALAFSRKGNESGSGGQAAPETPPGADEITGGRHARKDDP